MNRLSRAPMLIVALLLAAAAHAAGPSPWWAAYGDPALDRLMAAAQAADEGDERTLVQAFIVGRIQQARLLLAEQLLRAGHAEQALLMNAEPSPERDAALAQVADRLQQVEALQQGIAGERGTLLARLAQYTGAPLADVSSLLQLPEGRALPQVDQPVPAGDDEPSRRVAALANDTARLQQLLQARRLEMEAAQTRERAGAAHPQVALRTYQQLVMDTDNLTVAAGRLALAWAAWLPR